MRTGDPVTGFDQSLNAQVAAPVYTVAAAKDFSGMRQPGDSTTASYFFAVPKKDIGTVVMVVDTDNAHQPAAFVTHP